MRGPSIRGESLRAGAWGAATTVLLAVLVVVGSRNLAHFDAALVAYTFAMLFATFGLTYRYAMWLQRPPTGALLAARLAGVLPPRLAAAQPRHLGCSASAPRCSPTASSCAATGCAASPTC